jgi:nucleoside-diphosphate-sugar epimerase
VPAVKAVVTGSTGFIGTHLVAALVARDYRVTGIDRRSAAPVSGAEHLTLDLVQAAPELLGDLVSDANLVFHLAALPGVRGSGPSIEEARRRDNVEAACALLSVVPLDVPVVATSSSSVYGTSSGPGSSEDDPLRPMGGYARSKIAMEEACERHRARGGVVAVVRPFTVAGEGQRPDMAFSVWLRALRRGEPIRIFGSEERSRDVTDIRDVVEGLIRAGERGVDEPVNLGTGVGHRLIDLARTLIEVSGIEGEIVRTPVSTEDVDATRADTTRCRELLGLEPRTDLRQLLARQVEAATPDQAVAGT